MLLREHLQRHLTQALLKEINDVCRRMYSRYYVHKPVNLTTFYGSCFTAVLYTKRTIKYNTSSCIPFLLCVSQSGPSHIQPRQLATAHLSHLYVR